MAPSVNKVDVNAIDKSGETALIRESRLGDSVFIRSLIEKGADVNFADPYGYTALIYASRYGYIHVVKLLTENGANLNSCDHNGYNSLMWASREGFANVVQHLIESGANVDMIGKDGKTALLMEITNNRILFAKMLIENGANVNTADSNGLTPLMAAVAKNNLDIIKLLLQKGADVSATDKDGMTAIMKASQAGHFAIAKHLHSHFHKVMMSIEKQHVEHIHRIESSMEVIEGRNRMFKLLLDPDASITFLTKGYIKDCTQDYASSAVLGGGAFGVAFFGEDKEYNAKLKYVVKRAKVTLHTKDALEIVTRAMQGNISALMRSRHTNIARMYGYWFDENSAVGPCDIFFLFEYPSKNGHLLDILIHDEKRQHLSAKRRVKIIYEVGRALSFMHKGVSSDGSSKSSTFVHRDIKASTIYLTTDYTVKLMDCGLSSLVDEQSSSVRPLLSFSMTEDLQVMGTPGYVCPSYAAGKLSGGYDSSCDLYSFGIVMMELLSGWPQFGQSNLRSCPQNLIRKYHEKSILLSGLDEMAGDGWDPVVGDLCDCAFSCVRLDNRERPSTDEIFEALSDVYTRMVLSPTTSPTKL